MNKRTWTDEQLTKAVQESFSYAQTIKILGLKFGGGTYDFIKSNIERLGLSTDHFTGRRWSKGRTLPARYSYFSKTLDQILVVGSPLMGTHALKKRLIKEGLLEHKCYICGLTEWRGLPVPIQIDHINGNREDNRLENLRILCPNCHAQTDTWCGKNVRT